MAMDWSNIRPSWNKVIQRCQGEACRQQGYAILTISILVNEAGDVVLYTAPSCAKIEPMGASQNVFYQIMKQALNHGVE